MKDQPLLFGLFTSAILVLSLTGLRFCLACRLHVCAIRIGQLPLLVVAGLIAILPVHAQTFTVSFNTFSGPDCIKNKFGVYQTPFMGTDTFPPNSDSVSLTSMAPFLADAGVHDLRYEIAWGKGDTYAYDQIGGTETSPTIDFTRLDPFVQMLQTNGVAPLFAIGYDPLPLQSCGGCWQGVPDNFTSWQSIAQQYATHYSSSLDFKGICYEIWNEPDLPSGGGKEFFAGDQSDYGNVYAHAVAGINTGASDALVGGPAVAYDTSYYTEGGLASQPLNFASIHSYANGPDQIAAMESALGSRNVPIYITEYNSYTTFSSTGPNSTYPAAAAFFEDAKMFLTYANVEKVYWAQWIDDDVGMITYSLHKKALYNAYKIYQTLLPVNRNTVSPDSSSGIDTMAAADGASGNAGIVAWNNNTTAASVTINLNNLPGGSGTLQLYRIDSQNASYIDNPSSENLSVISQWTYSTPSSSWAGTIPGQGTMFILATPSAGLESPYGGTAWAVPGTVQNENFDNGGEGIAYHDSDPANQGGQYRTNDGVDIEATTDTGGGYDVGWTAAGEWLKYTVNVQTSGVYNVSFRLASAASGGTVHLLDQNGVNLTGSVTVGGTGGWQNWTTANATATLSAGVQTLELYEDTGNVNLNYMTFTLTAPLTVSNLVFTAQPANTAAGATMSEVDVKASSSLGASIANASVTLSVGSGTGSLGGTLTQTTDVNGLAHFTNLVMTVAGAKTLTAVSGMVSTNSTSFNITAGGVAQLIWSTQPANIYSGQPFGSGGGTAPVLATADQYGNPSVSGLAATLYVTVSPAATVGPLVAASGRQTYNIGTSGGDGVVIVSNLAITATGAGNQLRGWVNKGGVLPTDIGSGTLQVWLDAADTNYLTFNGSSVSAWNDKSGHGRSASQSVSGNQPIYHSKSGLLAGGGNTGYVLGFNGSSQILSNLNLTSLANTPYAVFSVVARTNDNSYPNYYLGNVADGTTDHAFIMGWNATNSYLWVGYGDNGGVYAVPGYGSQTFSVFSDFMTSASSHTVYEDGVSLGATAMNELSSASSYLNNGSVGGWNQNSPVVYFAGDLAEIVVYTGTLSLTDVTNVGSYLASKWTTAPALASATTTAFTVQATGSLTFSTQPANTAAGVTMSAVVVKDTNSLGVVTNASVTLSVGSGTGSLGGTLTQTTDVNGLAHFTNLVMTVAGAKTLTAVSGMVSTNSTSFNITAGGVAQLIWSTQPANIYSGQPFGSGGGTAPVLATADQYGNPSVSGLAATLYVTVSPAATVGPLVAASGRQTYNIGTSGGDGVVIVSNLAITATGAGNQLRGWVNKGGVLPTDIGSGTLQVWLDAADTNYLTFNGSSVSAWNDKSGHGRSASQSVSGNQPIYHSKSGLLAGGGNTGYVLGFNGSSQILSNLNLTSLANTPYAVFSVVARTNDNSYPNYYLGNVADGTTDHAFIMGWNATNSYLWVGYGDNGGVYAVPGYGSQTFSVFSDFMTSASSHTVYEDGVSLGATAMNELSSASSYLNNGSVGGWNQNSPVVYFAGDLAEIVVYTGTLSLTDVTNVGSYLASKWTTAPALASATTTAFTVQATNGMNLVSPPVLAIVAGASYQKGAITLTFAGTPGTAYHVETTTSLVPPVTWTTLPGSATNAPATGTWEFTDPQAQNLTQRFYRLVSP